MEHFRGNFGCVPVLSSIYVGDAYYPKREQVKNSVVRKKNHQHSTASSARCGDSPE